MKSGFLLVLALSVAAVGGLFFLLNHEPATEEGKQPLKFYCAAGVYKAATSIAQAYSEEEFGVPIQIIPGGSGALLAEVRGAKGEGHLYLTADPTYVAKGRQQGLLAEAIPVARWHPVLAVAPGNPAGVKSIADVLRPDVKLVIANPEAASIGRTVREALRKTGEWQKIEQKKKETANVTYVGTVPDVANQLATKSAHAGFLWTVTAQDKKLEYLAPHVLEQARQTIYICAIDGQQRPASALQFARYLTSRDKGMPVFQQFGFKPIEDADEWSGPHPEVTIYSGTMLKPGIEAAIDVFERREGVKINTVYNGCGVLVGMMGTQIRESNRVKPEVYFSCDATFMKMVEQHFEPSVDLSRNKMVIAVRKASPRFDDIQSLMDLTKPGLKLGFTDHEKSALGELTRRMLTKVDLWDEIQRVNPPRLWESGHALVVQARTALDAAIVYKSNVLCDEANARDLHIIEIPLPDAIATQPFAVSKNAKHRHLMNRLLDALTTAQTAKRFGEIGFDWVYEGRKDD